MNTLKINVPIPEGYKATAFNEQTGEVTLSEIPKDIKERLQSFLDVLAYHNHTPETFRQWCEGLRPHEIGGRKEELIAAAYNERQLDDPLPNWRDGKAKIYPIFSMPDPSGAGFAYNDCDDWHSYSGVGSRLVFLGDNAVANMKDATKKFLPEYKESRTL
jgi:hypothetical protein